MEMVHWCTQSETIRNRIVPTKVFEKYSLTGFLKHDYLFSITLSESQKPAFDLNPNVVCFTANFEISWYSWARERPAHWHYYNAFTIVASRPRRVVSLSGATHSLNQYLTIHFTARNIDYPASYSKPISYLGPYHSSPSQSVMCL